jgi:hypothetical protein
MSCALASCFQRETNSARATINDAPAGIARLDRQQPNARSQVKEQLSGNNRVIKATAQGPPRLTLMAGAYLLFTSVITALAATSAGHRRPLSPPWDWCNSPRQLRLSPLNGAHHLSL